MTDKAARLMELARRRQATRWEGYCCIGDYHEGVYECDFVSPYSRSAHNADAQVMVLLQDWSSDEVLSGPYLEAAATLGHDTSRVTNKRLKDLLCRHLELDLEQVYATNVFPFVKRGAIKASIPMHDLMRAARVFAIPQIEIVAPRLAICLGKAAFDAVVTAAGGHRSGSLADAIEFPFGNTQLWCQARTGQQGTNQRNRIGPGQVERDWGHMVSAYRRRRP